VGDRNKPVGLFRPLVHQGVNTTEAKETSLQE